MKRDARPVLLERLDIDAQSVLSEAESAGFDSREDTLILGALASTDVVDSDLFDEIRDLSELIEEDPEAEEILDSIRVDGRVTVTVSDDGMRAEAVLMPALFGGSPVGKAELIESLRTAGIGPESLVPEIDRILDEARSTGKSIRRVIAVGRPVVHGKDGRVEWYIKPAAEVGGDGSYVRKDDLLGKIIEPSNGIDGLRVDGKVVTARSGSPARPVTGRGIYISSDELRAARDGLLIDKDGRFDVKNILVINGDIGPETGDIDFPGSVIVKGFVKRGYSLKAAEEIDIRGGVEAAGVVSRRGDITVGKGFQGAGIGILSAGGDVSVSFIENGTVFAEGDINVRKAIMHSEVTSGGLIDVSSGRGAIIGGLIRATKGMRAREIGSSVGTDTVIILGFSPNLLGELRRLSERRAEMRSLIERITPLIRLLDREYEGGNLDDAGRLRLIQLKKKRIALMLSLRRAEGEMEISAGEAAGCSARLDVTGGLNPGVRVSAGAAHLAVKEWIPYATVKPSPDGKEMLVRPYGGE